MYNLKRSGATLGALACSMMITAQAVHAQEPQVEIEPCTATVQPEEVEIGQKAVAVTAMLSAPIGGITEISTSEENGLHVAAPADLPRTEMAAEVQALAITMDESGSEVTVWLNTEEATAGEHEVTFMSTESSCVGTVTVR